MNPTVRTAPYRSETRATDVIRTSLGCSTGLAAFLGLLRAAKRLDSGRRLGDADLSAAFSSVLTGVSVVTAASVVVAGAGAAF